jgi:hypothetical protein
MQIYNTFNTPDTEVKKKFQGAIPRAWQNWSKLRTITYSHPVASATACHSFCTRCCDPVEVLNSKQSGGKLSRR